LTADPDGMIKHNCARGNRHGLTSFERSLRTLGRITESVLAGSLRVRDAVTATIAALISPGVLSAEIGFGV
jgi:hypothetical protein